GFLQPYCDQDDLERGNGLRPDDSALIVILLDGRGHDARHTNAVTTHVQGHFLATFVEDDPFHGLAVLGSQLEDVTDFDAPDDLQPPVPPGAGVAVHHVPDIGCDHALHVAVPVRARQMQVLFV